MIQDIAPHVLHNQFDPSAVCGEEDFIIHFQGGAVLIKSGQEESKALIFPKAKDFEELPETVYLFSLDETRYFIPMEQPKVPEGYEYVEIRNFRSMGYGPKELSYVALTGKHLADWYRDTCHCGRCGGVMGHSKKERARVCTECGFTTYPRIMPAVIVGVRNGEKLLLTKYRTGFRNNALIAGFVEIGETMEETVAREVMEEAGVKVKNITYYKSQPWGLANDILAGYYCDLDGDETIEMDPEELSYAEWVMRDEIVLQPDDYSLTNEMMMMFKNGKM